MKERRLICRTSAVIGIALFVFLAVIGCGAGGGAAETNSSGSAQVGTAPSPEPSLSPPRRRYGPGDPDCRARTSPGTVGSIGEDIIGSGVRGFIECYGPPLRERMVDGRRCLFYRNRGSRTYWQFCVSEGRIVSGLGSLPRPVRH
jgi:hypothetical protein